MEAMTVKEIERAQQAKLDLFVWRRFSFSLGDILPAQGVSCVPTSYPLIKPEWIA
jgi:hypothetical protein